MKTMTLLLSAVLLAASGIAGAGSPAAEPLAIEHEALPAYWTPAQETTRQRLPEPSPLRRGRARPMSTSVTVASSIDRDGKVRDVEILDAQPRGSDPAWAVRALKSFDFEPAAENPGRTPVRWTQTVTLGTEPPAASTP